MRPLLFHSAIANPLMLQPQSLFTEQRRSGVRNRREEFNLTRHNAKLRSVATAAELRIEPSLNDGLNLLKRVHVRAPKVGLPRHQYPISSAPLTSTRDANASTGSQSS